MTSATAVDRRPVCAYLRVPVRAGHVVGWMAVVAAGAALPLLLVDAIPLALRQVEEVLHGLQVDQQRLRGSARVLLLAQDLRQQPLGQKKTNKYKLKNTTQSIKGHKRWVKLCHPAKLP